MSADTSPSSLRLSRRDFIRIGLLSCLVLLSGNETSSASETNRDILLINALNLRLYKPFEWPADAGVKPVLWHEYTAEKIYWSKWDRVAFQEGGVPIQQRLLQGEGELHGRGVYDIEIPNGREVKFVDIGVQVKDGVFTFRAYEPIYDNKYASGIINAGPKRWMPKPGAITSILAVNSSHPDDKVTSQTSIDAQIHAWNRIQFEDRDMVFITHALPYRNPNNNKYYLRMLEVAAWLLEKQSPSPPSS